MAKGNNKGMVIFLAIISIAGLGLSGYMFVTDLFSDDSENLKLVALWDNLDENIDTAPYDTYQNFLFEYSDQMVLNTDYITVHNSTRFSFATMGLYKINLKTVLTGIDATFAYWIILLQDDTQYRHFDRWDEIDDSYHYTDSSLYINVTNSDSVYGILGYGSVDDFSVSSSSITNQLSIEYVVP